MEPDSLVSLDVPAISTIGWALLARLPDATSEQSDLLLVVQEAIALRRREIELEKSATQLPRSERMPAASSRPTAEEGRSAQKHGGGGAPVRAEGQAAEEAGGESKYANTRSKPAGDPTARDAPPRAERRKRPWRVAPPCFKSSVNQTPVTMDNDSKDQLLTLQEGSSSVSGRFDVGDVIIVDTFHQQVRKLRDGVLVLLQADSDTSGRALCWL